MCHRDPDDGPVPGIKTAEKRRAQKRKDAELERIMEVEHPEFGRTKKNRQGGSPLTFEHPLHTGLEKSSGRKLLAEANQHVHQERLPRERSESELDQRLAAV